jgi:hypothetical protein
VEHVVTNRVYVRELAKEGANAEALFRTRTGDPLLTMEVATLPLRSFLRPDG